MSKPLEVRRRVRRQAHIGGKAKLALHVTFSVDNGYESVDSTYMRPLEGSGYGARRP